MVVIRAVEVVGGEGCWCLPALLFSHLGRVVRAFLLAASCVSLEDGMTQVNCCLYFSVWTSLIFGALLGSCSFLIVLQRSSRNVFIHRYLLSHVEDVELGEKDWVLLIYYLSDITPVNSLFLRNKPFLFVFWASDVFFSLSFVF